MRYLALSSLALPATAPPETVFVFLCEDGAAPATYRLALLLSDDNVLAAAVLEAFGFVKIEALPGGQGLAGAWSFHVCNDSGPFPVFTDNTGADPARRISRFFDHFDFPSGGTVQRDPALHVNEHAVPTGLFNAAFDLLLAFVELDAAPAMRFAAADNSSTTAVGFRFGLETARRNGQPIELLPHHTVTLELVPNTAGAADTGGVLKMGEPPPMGSPDEREVVVGAEDGRVWFRETAFSGAIQLNTGGGLELEIDVGSPPAVHLGPARLATVTLESDALVARFDAVQAGFAPVADPTLPTVDIRLRLEFPLLRGEAADSFVVPWRKNFVDEFSLDYRTVVRIDRTAVDAAGAQILAVAIDSGGHAVWGWPHFLEHVATHAWPLTLRHEGLARFDCTGLNWDLTSIFGEEKGGVQLSLAPAPGSRLAALEAHGGEFHLKLPFRLTLELAGCPVEFDLDLTIDLARFRLAGNPKIPFRFAPGTTDAPMQVVDFGILALALPTRAPGGGAATDGYIDFAARELVINAMNGLTAPVAFVPGGLSGDDVESRVLLRLEAFTPESWPEPGNHDVYLRITPAGVSLRAVVEVDHAPTVYRGPGKPLALALQPDRHGVRSEIVVIDSVFRRMTLFAEMEVPGFDDLKAAVELAITQTRGEPPVLEVKADVDTSSGRPLAQMSVGYLQFTLDDLRATLRWVIGTNDWSLGAVVDGSLSLAAGLPDSGGLGDLRNANAIQVRDLDVLNLHKGPGKVTLQLAPNTTVDFTCLDGMFSVSLARLEFEWGPSFTLRCGEASFRFNDPGSLAIQVDAGGIALVFENSRSVKLTTPSSIGLGMTIGSAVSFYGAFCSRNENGDRYFSATGKVHIEQFEADVFVKIGTQTKENGQVAPSLVIYGSMPYEVPLFAGVVAKEFGAGIGINNRLAAFPDSPDAEAILPLIDRLDPATEKGWAFVERNGFHLTIVGTVLLASNSGPPDTVSAYVAYLVLSIDLELRVKAAGKIWVACSVEEVKKPQNWSRPALVGAIVMLPKERLINGVIESRPNPFVQDNPTLQKILNQGHVKFSFLMSPRLVDFHLEDVSYRDEFLGAEMQYRGSLRISVFDSALLVLMNQSITGRYRSPSLKAGPGGFEAQGDLDLGVDFGGILSGNGLAAYGAIHLRIWLMVRAYIEVGFSFTIDYYFGSETVSWTETFDLAETELDLGLDGEAGFEENGQFGFDGTLSISVDICGYTLSISPSLAINAGVIRRVRERCQDFESRVEAVKRELLGRSAVPFAPTAAFVADEPWLHQHYKGRHLLLPRSDATWFAATRSDPAAGPEPLFEKMVTRIVVRDAQGNELANVVPAWADDSVPMRQERARAWLVETTPRVADNPVPLAEWVLKADPRVAAGGREYWTDVDAATLPDHALPLRFKSAEEVLAAESLPAGVDEEFGELAEYAYWQARGLRLDQHRGEPPRHHSNRGAMLHRLFAARDTLEADPASTNEEALVWAPLWFSLPTEDWDPTWTVTVERTTIINTVVTSVEETVAVTSAATLLGRLGDQVLPLPPRQGYVVDRPAADRDDEAGRVVVKLPVKLDPAYIADGTSAAVKTWQLWRQLPGEPVPRCIRTQCQPRIRWLRDTDSDGTTRTIALHEPYVAADSFPVVGASLADAGLVADTSVVRYHLRPLSWKDDPQTLPRPDAVWTTLVPHVPSQDPLPASLAMIWTVLGLVHDGTARRFTLAVSKPDGDGHRWIPATLAADDFEPLAEAVAVGQNGFYGLNDESVAVPPNAGRATIGAMRAGLHAAPTETLHGKIPLLLTGSGPEFEIADVRLAPGFAYRFFVRPRGPERDGQRRAYGLVRELPLFFVQVALPPPTNGTWDPSPNLRGASEIEFIPQAVRQALIDNTPVSATDLPLSIWREPFDSRQVAKRPAAVRARLGIGWDLSTAPEPPGLLGGLEFRMRDSDDSRVQESVLCELLDEPLFRLNRRDFRVASEWRLSAHDQWDRLDFRPATTPPPVPGSAALPVTLMLDLDSRDNPLLEQVLACADAYRDSLGDEAPTWAERWSLARELLEAVSEYRRSPLNLGDADITEAIERLITLVQWHFTGLRLPAVTRGEEWTRGARDAAAAAVRDLVAELIDARPLVPVPTGNAPVDRAALRAARLDDAMARELAWIVRRRLRVALELVTGDDDNVPDQPPRNSGPWLPEGARFEEVRDRVETLTAEIGSFPRCARLLELFPRTDARSAVGSWAAPLILEALDKFQDLATYNNNPPNPKKLLRNQAAAGLVPHAAGLTRALRRLRADFRPRGWRLIRRPHHNVVRGEWRDGLPRPQIVPFAEAYSDETRLETFEPDAEPPPPSREVPALLNFLETMGFAVDIAAVDALGQFVPAEALADAVAAAGLEGEITLVQGRAADSDRLDPAYSFCKLVVVPDEFATAIAAHRLLAGPQDDQLARQAIDATVEWLANWLAARGIKTHGAAPLIRVGTTLAYLHWRDQASTGLRVVSLDAYHLRARSLPLTNRRGAAAWFLPDDRGRRFCVPVGRVVSRYEPLLRWAEPGLPAPRWPEDRTAVLHLPRLAVGPEPATRDVPEYLPVAVHSHPTTIAFSLGRAEAERRARANLVAEVRTGFAGVTLAFRADLADHPDAERTWAALHAAMRRIPDAAERLPDPRPLPTARPSPPPVNPRILAGEELLMLENKPYYLDYTLEARTQYERLRLGPAPARPGPAVRTPARRQPRLIAVRPPQLAPPAPGNTWTLTLLLTRTGDLLTPPEVAAAPPRVPVQATIADGGGTITELIPPDRLLEPAMGYHFAYRLGGENGVDPCFVEVAELLLPWHGAYIKPEAGSPLRPLFRSLSGNVHIADTRPVVECGVTADGPPNFAYRVVLTFTTTDGPPDVGLLFEDPDRRRFRVSRGGHQSDFLTLPHP